MADQLLKVAQNGVAQINGIISLDWTMRRRRLRMNWMILTPRPRSSSKTQQMASIVGAQTAYAGIITIREGIETLDRSLAALDPQYRSRREAG